jgi:hypothetical protein
MQTIQREDGRLPEQPLNQDEASLRERCERAAQAQYPGARVLVERDPRGIVAGVVLPEDGADLDVSAVRAGPCASAGEALQALQKNLERPTPTLED